MRKFNLEVVRGDTIPLKAVVSRDGSVMNIAGSTFRVAGKRWLNDSSYIFESTDYEIVSSVEGIVVITIPPEATEGITDTIDVHTDIEMIEADDRKTTVARGILRILVDVAR